MSEVVPKAPPSGNFVILHLLAASTTWGCSFLFIKMIGDGLSPVVLASVRAIGGTAALAIVVLSMGQGVWPRGREWQDWVVLGTLNGWIANILVNFALTRMDSGPAALIQASGPLMTAVLAHLLLSGERLTKPRFMGIVIGLVGVGILIGPDALFGGATALAALAMLGVTVGYSLGNIYARVVPKADPLRLAFGQQWASMIFSTAIVLLTTGTAGYARTPEFVWPVALLCIVSTALPIWLFLRLLTAAGPTKAAMTGYIVPVVALVAGVLLLGEPLALRQIIGGIIVLLGVAIVTGLVRLPPRTTP